MLSSGIDGFLDDLFRGIEKHWFDGTVPFLGDPSFVGFHRANRTGHRSHWGGVVTNFIMLHGQWLQSEMRLWDMM